MMDSSLTTCRYFSARLPLNLVQFDHPWFQTWMMFLGEGLLIIVFLTNISKFRRDPVYASGKVTFRIFQPILIIPTTCDLTGSTVGNFALLLISASVWQMLRASNIIFTGLLSVLFLKRRLNLFHWLGMFLVACGVALVGVSSLLNTSSGSSQTHSSSIHTAIGCCLVLVSQLIAACQMVLEERLLKHAHFPAVQVVGTEGCIGVALMTCIVLPAVHFANPKNPLHDNALHAFAEIANNRAAFIFPFLCCFSLFLSCLTHLAPCPAYY